MSTPSETKRIPNVEQSGSIYGKKLAIIADGPSNAELRENHPLIGPSGKNLFLFLMLATGRSLKLDSFSKKAWNLFPEVVLLNVHPDGKRGERTISAWLKDIKSLDEFPVDLKFLVLGAPARKAFKRLVKRKECNFSPAAKITSSTRIAYWHHPSPQNATKFWADDAGKTRDASLEAYIERIRFVRNALK
ncbi:MAG: hypothetical protein AABZ06_15285 [Bdellovibrionota bacterium]